MGGRVGTLAPGTVVGGLTVESPLGEGGFGAVYRARDGEGRAYALKISNVVAQRLRALQLSWQQNEVEALRRLRHASLVQVESFGVTDDGRFFLVMELVEGARLDLYLAERGRLDVVEALQFARRIADALAHCHARNVLHLDLKPHNIIVVDPAMPSIKILDFGLAQMREAVGLEQFPFRAGTLGYTPPERFVDAAAMPSARQDLYSLGAILFELLTGVRPFENDSADELIARQVARDAPSVRAYVASIPEPVAELVGSLLARDPARRFGSAALLCTRLKELYYSTLGGGEPSDDATDKDTYAPPASEDAAFTGRVAELERLQAEADAVAAGEGRSILLVGEPGIGKSRLVTELLGSRIRREAIVTNGRCRHIGELLPYAPLREVLGQLAATVQRMGGSGWVEVRQDLAGVLASEGAVLRALAPEFDELSVHGDDRGDLSAFRLGGADRVARAIRRALAAVAAETMIIVVLEDLHWADEGTLAVLHKLLEKPPPSGVLVLATARSTDRMPAGVVRTLAIEPLPPEHNDELLVALAGGWDVEIAARLKAAIPLLATGNPLCNTQVIRDLEAAGYLRHDDAGRPHLDIEALRGDYAPPDSVTRVLERIVWRLEPGVLEILGAAAMIGRQFFVSDLCGLRLFSEADVRAAVAEAEVHCLARTAGDSGQFVHDTIRDALEGTVPAERLQEIHRAIAKQLVRRGAAPAALGRHLERAGDARSAARAYFEAGLEADRLHDPHGARRHLARALELLMALSEREPGELVRVMHELVRVGCVFGNTGETVELLDRCAAQLPERSPEEEVALHSSYARVYYVQGQMPKAMEHSSAALSTLENDPRLAAYQSLPANVVGRALCVSGRFGPATRMLTRGCEFARDTGEWVELSHSEGLLAVALGFTGRFDEAAARAASSLRLARRLGDPIRTIGCHVYNSALAEARFDWETGIRETTQLLAFAEENSIGGLYLYVGTTMAGRHQFHVGHLDRARVLLGNALAMSKALNIVMLLSWTHAYLGDVYFVAGKLDDARRHYTLGLEAASALGGDEYAGPLCLVGLAHLAALERLAEPEVLAPAEQALARLAAVENVSARVVALQRVGEAFEAVGAVERVSRAAAERADLAVSLGLGAVDFWPSRQEPLAAPPVKLDPRDRPTVVQRPGAKPVAFGTTELAAVGELTAESAPAAADTGAEAAERGRSGGESLYDRLSTIEGFVPRF